MALPYNDGSIPYGSRVITIDSVDYVADSITVNRPTKEILRTNELDEPAGSVTIEDFVKGSATLQLATGSTAIPVGGLTFTETFGASAEDFIVQGVDQPEEKGGERKVNITFIKAYNA